MAKLTLELGDEEILEIKDLVEGLIERMEICIEKMDSLNEQKTDSEGTQQAD